jgi:hypothetical protein
MNQKRKELFDYMDLATREQYLAHRTDFEKNVNQWKLTPETADLLMRASEIAWDTETVPQPPPGTYKHLTPSIRENLGLTYLTSVTHVVFYAVVDKEPVAVVLVAPFTDEEIDFAKQLFARKDCLFIGHKHAFDLRIFCGHHDVPVPERTYCTLVGQTTMIGGPKKGYPDGSRRTLDSLADMYELFPLVEEVASDVAEHWYKGEEIPLKQKIRLWLAFMKKNRKKLHTLPAQYVAAYVVTDGIFTFHAYKAQMYWSKVLHEQYGYDALWERHREDQQYNNILARWIVRGFPVNREWIKQQLSLIQAEKERLLPFFIEWGCGTLSRKTDKFRFIFHVCESPMPDPWYWVDFGRGRGKWYPADMQHNLWTDTAFREISKKGWEEDEDYSKWYSTGADAIKYYLKFGPEEHRSKLKLYEYFTQMLSQESTYREWLDHSEYDGKVHSVLVQNANTGRTNGDTPNPLNINMDAPKEVEVYDPATGGTNKVLQFTGRGMLAPHPGKVLLEFDASNAEVRLATVLAKCMNLAAAFAAGRDMHKENAAAFYITPYIKVTYKQRSDGKGVFFAMQYGGGTRKITSEVLQELIIVQEMIDNWNQANWEVGVAKSDIERAGMNSYRDMRSFPIPAFRQAYTELWNGRWVPAPTKGGDPLLYPLWNSQQQGGVAGIVNPSVIKTHFWLQKHPEYRSDMYLMIHDSIIAEVPEDDEEAARAVGRFISKQLMTQIPYEMSIVGEHRVPWPSGCDLYENKDKWGWRPGKEFPFYCGEDEGDVVITFPEDEAWEIMHSKAVKRATKCLSEAANGIDRLIDHDAVGLVPWREEDDTITGPITHAEFKGYSREMLNDQARYWSRAIDQFPDLVPTEYLHNLKNFVEWVQELDEKEQQYEEAATSLQRLKEEM